MDKPADNKIQEMPMEEAPHDARIIAGAVVKGMFKPRKRDAHKGDFGKLMIVTGSPGMTGAGCLAAEAALTAGAGLVYLAVPGRLAYIYEIAIRETITLGVGGDNIITCDNVEEILDHAERMDAIAIGPGMSTGWVTARAIRRIIASVNKPLVIDADALTAIAADVSFLDEAHTPAVLTPHEAEMARLLGKTAADVTRNRYTYARNFAVKHKVTLVLKGRRSVVAAPDGRVHINTTGNPGMATAGAGDVLTGVIAAFIGAGMSVTEAAIAAVYLHGLAGDAAAAKLGERSVRASDIIRCLPDAFIATGI